MKKSTGAIGVIVILGIAYVGSTWYVGKRTQEVVQDAVEQANARVVEMLGDEAARSGAQLAIIDYQRGLFSSNVVYSLNAKDAKGEPFEIRLQDHVQHGPFPLGALKAGRLQPLLAHSDTTLVATPTTQAWVDSQNGASPLTASTDIDFSGNGRSIWAFQPATFEGKDNIRFDFSGGTLSMDFSNDFKDNSAKGQFDSLIATDTPSGGSVQIKGIEASGTSRTDAQDTVTSESQATIASVLIDSGEAERQADESFTLENVVAHLNSTQAGPMLDGTLRYDFGRVLVGKTDMGSITLGGKLSQLDVKALVALGNEYDAIAAAHGAEQDEDFRLTQEDQAALQAKAMTVLASSPKIEFDPVVWKNAKGESRASLHLNLAAPSGDGAQSAGMLVPEYINKLALSLNVSRAMLIEMFGQLQQDQGERQQLEQMGGLLYDQYVSRLGQAELVKVDSDQASTDILYEDNGVVVNGKAMSVQDFMMRAMTLLM
ncbi:YdgA family protein [Allopusillimonas ginsengisoli]|uniref:YdgA family protein n=1 Tax=Allopusillimonas ginsengisoli TaxID=453575 RepID=UPI0014304263|nr:YdgA family protein [Allopusillimonas ginsengisoli]